MKNGSAVSLGLAATFTAEPLGDALGFWWTRLEHSVDACFAPFHQVFQQLLDPGSVLARSTFNVLLVRWEDWAGGALDAGAMERSADELVQALERTTRPTLLVLCHPSPAATTARGTALFTRLDERVAAGLGGTCAVTIVRTADLARLYPVAKRHEPYGARAGAVPYSPEYFTALATMIARHVARWLRRPYKVIVLDADGTLWRGACGEVGPGGVIPHTELQRFFVEQRQSGMLLCLCSKNEPMDVRATFAAHPEMPLRPEHFVAQRINWRAKSENVRSLAEELGLSLDCFVVVDDSPLECAEIANGCPEVVTLALPETAAPETFLHHVWAFDHGPATVEDRRRTVSYREQRERTFARARARTLAEFLDGLELAVDLRPLAEDNLERVAQLTQRTTQFNTTGRIWQEPALRAALAGGEVDGIVASVRDRFGDYGLVGAALFRAGDRLDVDTFVLSCRALGRGVEHRMLARLGTLAHTAVRLPCVTTDRNVPARTFLATTVGRWETITPDGRVYDVPADAARTVVNDAMTAASAPPPPDTVTAPPASPVWASIAAELSTVEAIHRVMMQSRLQERPGADFVPARSHTETRVTELWAKAFGLDRVSRDDDFFELGGHSLLATRIMASIWAAFQLDLPLETIESARTPGALAARIDEGLTCMPVEATAPEVLSSPGDRHAPFPLSPLQQASWIGRGSGFALGNVGSGSYVEFDFEGLDLERYESAWQATIDRHDQLRAIVLPDGRMQVLEQVPRLHIPVLDLSSRTAAQTEAALEQRREKLSLQILAPDRWPVFDLRATRLKGDRVRVHVSFDGLMHDLFSERLILGEVAARYDDPSATWPELEFTSREYRMAQSARHGNARWQRARAYWSARLNTMPLPPTLPLARSPESIVRPRFVRRSARLPAAAWRRLVRGAKDHSLTSSGVLLAAFSEVLAAWSTSNQFTLNLATFDRLPLHPQIDELVGSFTSMVLVAVDTGGAPTFAERARLVQTQVLRDMDHREVSGIETMRELSRAQKGQISMPVVFSSALALDLRSAALANVPAREVYAVSQTPQVWLDHKVFEVEGELVLHWDAVDELFPAGLLDAMLDAYTRILRELAASPAAWGSERFDVVPTRDLAVRAAANDTAGAVPALMLTDLFDAQVTARPDAPAVIAAGCTLTYETTARLAHRLARWIRACGVEPGAPVGVAMRKGWEQVVGALGILYAGGAYLPLDPSLPAERLHLLAREAGVKLVLVQPGGKLDLPASVHQLELGEVALAAWDAAPPEARGTPDDLAYIIYTSGSTGLPKGVMIDHRGAVNTILDVNERYAVGPGDRALGLSSMSFDLSVYDIFGMLAAGGAVVFPDPTPRPDPAHWLELIARENVTIWNSVPALMELALECAGARAPLPQSVRLVMLSGDWIPTTLPGRIRAHLPAARLVGLGGATEASIWSIVHDIDAVDPAWPSIPYGKPMRNQSWCVLDDALASRPVWVPGELYIGGNGLARGYWRDPVRTAERFITHPRTGERLYRTGDLGRYHPDGTLEFLGREDFQVKVRGHRIELGEVEAALREHGSVKAAVVLAEGEPKQVRRLVAFVQPAGPGASPEELVQFLAQRLPDYMVPARCALVEGFPLTANGKVDRQALAALAVPAPQLPAAAPAVEPPALTAQVSALVAELLDLPAVDTSAGFIAQGGDSLLGMRLIVRIREAFGADLPLEFIFEDASVMQLAGEVERLAR